MLLLPLCLVLLLRLQLILGTRSVLGHKCKHHSTGSSLGLIRLSPQCKMQAYTDLLDDVSDIYNSIACYDMPMSSLLDFDSLPPQVQHVQVLSLAIGLSMIIAAI